MSRRDEILARLEAATPGPWSWNSYSGVFAGGPDINPAAHDKWFETVKDEPDEAFEKGGALFNEDYERDPLVAHVPAHHGDTATGRHAADAEFIAHAPEDIRWLLDRVAELESGNEQKEPRA